MRQKINDDIMIWNILPNLYFEGERELYKIVLHKYTGSNYQLKAPEPSLRLYDTDFKLYDMSVSFKYILNNIRITHFKFTRSSILLNFNMTSKGKIAFVDFVKAFDSIEI